MEEAALIDKLMLFGLTRQEASIYLCLAANAEVSGYEVAKITGISRSNVYNALASYAVAKLYDMSDELIQKGFNNFKSDGIRQSIFRYYIIIVKKIPTFKKTWVFSIHF